MSEPALIVRFRPVGLPLQTVPGYPPMPLLAGRGLLALRGALLGGGSLLALRGALLGGGSLLALGGALLGGRGLALGSTLSRGSLA